MRLTLLVSLIALLLSPGLAEASDRLAQVNSFALALGVDSSLAAEQLADYQMVIIDGQKSKSSEVSWLRQQGSLVIGQLSVGTIEASRPWYRQLSKYRLGRKSPGVSYADVKRSGYRQALRRIAAKLNDKGFDGLLFANSDMTEVYPSRRQGMRLLLSSLAGQQRQDGKLTLLQDNFSFLRNYSDYFDGWLRQNVSSGYDFVGRRYRAVSNWEHRRAGYELRQMGALGLKTMAVDYLAAETSPDPALLFACDQGALSFTSNIQLSRLGPPTPCPAE